MDARNDIDEEAALKSEVRKLVDRCLAGDQAAMLGLVERFKGQVFGLCYRMLGHRQDAEDMAQETFVRALRSLADWDKERDFHPWLFAIAGNRCRTLLSQRSRRPSSTPIVDHLPDRQPDEEPLRDLTEELELALERLRPEYRQAFLLFHKQELNYAEIADVLSCPVGTVKTWVHRARRELIDRLRSRGAFEEAPHAMHRL